MGVSRLPRLARVLVTDDDRRVRDAVARTLRRRGLIVDLAADGAEALSLASEFPYAVVVTDHRMPGLSGVEERPPSSCRLPAGSGPLLGHDGAEP